MRVKARQHLILIPVLFLGVWSEIWAQSAPSPTSVQVTEAIESSKATYSYTVVNNSALAVTRLSIGYDSTHNAAELTTFPLGWTLTGGLSPAGVTSPANWNAILITQEESPFFRIQWSSAQLSAKLPPSQQLNGFSITLPTGDYRYKTGYFDLLLSNLTHISGLLTFSGSKISGDLNVDGTVSCIDLGIVNKSYGKRAGDAEYDPVADVNKDGVVDVRDVAFISQKLPIGTRCQ